MVDTSAANGQVGHATKVVQDTLVEAATTGPVMRLIAGPCLIESRDHTLRMAEALDKITRDLPVRFVFKASWKKANRTRWGSPAGGETFLTREIIDRLDVLFLTDIHEAGEEEDVWADWLQIPALLSRQTDLIACAASRGKLNIKKGQFMAPHDVKWAVEKAKKANPMCHVAVTERGHCFGYNNLVVDFRSIPIMKATSGADEVLFDCTHSVQLPGGRESSSGGQREFIEGLARAAIVSGVDGLFCEVHDDPQTALSDGPCQIPLHHFSDFLKRMLELYEWQRANPSSSFPLASARRD